MNAVVQPRIEWLVSRLAPWVVVAGTTLALGGAPATDVLGLTTHGGQLSNLESAASPSTTGPSEVRTTLAEEVAWLRDASSEAKAAQRLLQGLREHLAVPEVAQYITSIGAVLERTPDVTSASDARQLGVGLRAAREQLDLACTTFGTWMAVARLVDPERTTFPVPDRLVRWAESVAEPPLSPGSSKFSLRRRIGVLMTEDADHLASAG